MIPSLPSWWEALRREDPDVKPPACPAVDRIRDPLKTLPRSFDWTNDLETWSRIDYEKPMSGFEMMMLQRACIIRGANSENHSERQKRFSKFKNELAARGFTIPSSLNTVFTNDRLFDLFRFPCQSFSLPDALASFPGDDRLILFLFLSDAQGCNFTHVLLAPNGQHVVTRSCHPYGLDDADDYTQQDSDERQLFCLADSFDAFICNAIDEIINFETEAASDWIARGDQLRDADRIEDAKLAYRLGLAYNPDCQPLHERLRASETG
ncbi:hypothetical protein [Novipirellula caenicola]